MVVPVSTSPKRLVAKIAQVVEIAAQKRVELFLLTENVLESGGWHMKDIHRQLVKESEEANVGNKRERD